MCWNQYVSLNTFTFSMFVLGLMIYNDLYSPYKLNFTNSVYLYFFIVSFASMQLVEYFIWKNINNKESVQFYSICGQLVVLLQPIASLLLLKQELLKWVMLLVYSVPTSYLFVTSNKNYKTTVRNGHLKWNWMPTNTMMELAWLFFLLFSFVVNGHYNYLIGTFILLIITYWSYNKNGTAGSLWCWSINLFMLYFAVKLLLVLPFQEHGLC